MNSFKAVERALIYEIDSAKRNYWMKVKLRPRKPAAGSMTKALLFRQRSKKSHRTIDIFRNRICRCCILPQNGWLKLKRELPELPQARGSAFMMNLP